MNKLKTSAAFGTDPFGAGESTDKIQKNPWGFSGGDTHSGLLEPSSGENHPNDYFSESETMGLTEKQLEEKKKRLKKLKKKKLKKSKLECDEIDLLTTQEIYILTNNILNFLKSKNSDSTHNYIGMVSAISFLRNIINQYHDCNNICDIKQKNDNDLLKNLSSIKGIIEKILNFIGVDLSDALNNNFENIDKSNIFNSDIKIKPEYKREYPTVNKNIDPTWYNEMYNYKRMNMANKTAQFGSQGPSLPFFDKPPSGSNKDWTSETFENIYQNQKNQNENLDNKKNINKYVDITITVYSYNNNEVEVGSGFFINNNTILTCAHVVAPSGQIKHSNNIEIKYHKKNYNATVLAYDYQNDLAALIIENNDMVKEYFTFANINKINIGDQILTIGSPLGFEDVVLKGEVASNKIKYENEINKEYLFISNNISQGNSGGPVLLEDTGEVIGIAAAVINLKNSTGGGLNAVIPIDTVQNFLVKNNIQFKTSR